MKNIALNVSERLFAIGLLNQFKGSHETLSFILEDIKKFAITEEDWKKAERSITKEKDSKGEDITSWVWDDEKGGDKKIEMSDQVVDYLKADIEEKNKTGEFTMKDRAVITLNKKLVEAK